MSKKKAVAAAVPAPRYAIKRMDAFYRLYPLAALDVELVPQPVAQLDVVPSGTSVLSLPVAHFPVTSLTKIRAVPSASIATARTGASAKAVPRARQGMPTP